MRASEHQIETPPQGRITSDVFESRAVAQTGSAFPWGGRGRKFKSCQPDSSLFLLVLAHNQSPF